jgi:hypothetical protein
MFPIKFSNNSFFKVSKNNLLIFFLFSLNYIPSSGSCMGFGSLKCLVKKCFLRLAPTVASQIRQVVTNVSAFPRKISKTNFQEKFPRKISKKNFQEKFPRKISKKNFQYNIQKKKFRKKIQKKNLEKNFSKNISNNIFQKIISHHLAVAWALALSNV